MLNTHTHHLKGENRVDAIKHIISIIYLLSLHVYDVFCYLVFLYLYFTDFSNSYDLYHNKKKKYIIGI